MSVTQTDFRNAILDGNAATPEGLRDAKGGPAGRRFDVYRNNVAVSLTEALETGFPVLRKLLGEENFKGVTGIYLRQSPPDSPMMMYYGASFPDFLRTFQPLQHIGYLGDVAELEMAQRRSYHAADAEAAGGDILARVPPEQLENLRLDLAPSVQIIRSPWPIYDIWRFNMVEGAPKPRAEAQDVLVTRPEFDPELHLLPTGGGTFVAALHAGETLGQAAAAASADTADFDLGACLALLLTGQAITTATT